MLYYFLKYFRKLLENINILFHDIDTYNNNFCKNLDNLEFTLVDYHEFLS